MLKLSQINTAKCGKKKGPLTIPQQREELFKEIDANLQTLHGNMLSTLDNILESTYINRSRDLYERVMNEAEKTLLSRVLEFTRGNQTDASKLMGISRSTLRKKLEKYNIMIEGQ